MKGAREYRDIKTGQHGRLYIVRGAHARGETLRIYVLPAGEKADVRDTINPPRNADAVEVYGIVSGQPGWIEVYGWLHHGPWVADFNDLVETQRAETRRRDAEDAEARAIRDAAENQRRLTLLQNY